MEAHPFKTMYTLASTRHDLERFLTGRRDATFNPCTSRPWMPKHVSWTIKWRTTFFYRLTLSHQVIYHVPVSLESAMLSYRVTTKILYICMTVIYVGLEYLDWNRIGFIGERDPPTHMKSFMGNAKCTKPILGRHNNVVQNLFLCVMMCIEWSVIQDWKNRF